jgi:iron complex transport system substrate-binding protein
MSARRIVSLLPSATEIVYALDIGDRLVGVTHECDFPEEARSKPVLTASALSPGRAAAEIDRHVRRAVHAGSSLYALDETMLADLEPDLILTQELCAVCAVSYEVVSAAVKRLRGDPRVVSLEPASLEDLYATIATVGELTATQERAASLVARLRERAGRLRAAHREGRRARVLVLEWTDPPMSAGHWIPELVELAGGEPVLGDPGANSRVLGWEEIAAADPDRIIVAPCGFDLARAEEAIADLRRRDEWNALRAVRTGAVTAIDGNAYVSRPGPRLIDSAELIAAALQGDGKR